MTTPRRQTTGTHLALPERSAPPVEAVQGELPDGPRGDSGSLGFATINDWTGRDAPRHSVCWQEVIRGGAAARGERLAQDWPLEHLGHHATADAVLLTDSDTENPNELLDTGHEHSLPVLLAESDTDNLNGLFGHEVAHNTIRSYRSQWRSFVTWAATRGIPALPARPEQVAVYLAERFERLGHKPATLRVATAAIAYVHNNCGLENPCAHPDVKRTLRGATRLAGKAQKQAKGLTAEALDAIAATACQPRLGTNGRRESAQAAARRGSIDIALVRLMRDAMLRVSECAALTWSDIETVHDGSGRLLIRRSKTDPDGEGAVVFVSAPTMAGLASIRNGAPAGGRVFELSPNQMALRIKKAAVAAGLGDGFSGHSPRVGMAQDLARIGVELPSLMTAGRWRSPTMPAHYTRNETADRGAVAQFYNYPRNPRQPPQAT